MKRFKDMRNVQILHHVDKKMYKPPMSKESGYVPLDFGPIRMKKWSSAFRIKRRFPRPPAHSQIRLQLPDPLLQLLIGWFCSHYDILPLLACHIVQRL